jgi:serine/threonine protein kinase
MDIGNLTKKSFTELVDKMLEIMYTGDKNSNDIKKINDLINIVCKKTLNTGYKIKQNNPLLDCNLKKILPCNNESSLLINKNIYINNPKSRDSSSVIFNNKIDNRIFKITIHNPNSYKSLFGFIFEYFLYYLINKSSYLCKIYEIGNYINSNNEITFYSIMDKCGVDIIDFFFKNFKPSIDISNKNEKQLNILFNNLLIIFYKMIECVKILHDLGYAHLDIKPENFLISTVDGSNLLNLIVTQNIENIVLVKIIDFELVRKIGSNINVVSNGICTICTEEYAHPDLLQDKKKDVVVLPKYDIESLRKSFIFILGIIFLNSNDYKSEIVKKTEKFNEQITKILAELNKLKGDNKPNKLDELITILDNIKNEKYKNIDFLLHNISRLIAINKTNSSMSILNKNTISVDLRNILSILVEVLFYKKNKGIKTNISDFYSKIYKKYTENDEFILEIIYKLLCENFVNEINDAKPNDIKTLIQNLKKINFFQYSFKNKKKNNGKNKNSINDLNEKDLFRKISPEKFQEGQNYFYLPNDISILYFGKLEKIEGLVSKTYIFKYYIGSDNLCDVIQLSAEDLEKINFYEFNFSKTIKDKNTKTSSIIDYGSKILRDFKGLFSSKIASKPKAPEPIDCSKYDKNDLQDIKTYTDVDKWVEDYCKKNGIIIKNAITIEKDSIYFTNERFKDFKGTEIYESGVGYFDCLIRSLLFSLSNNYRCLNDNDSRTNVASYFRRAFLPLFFKDKKEDLLKKKYNITEENDALYIIINGMNTKLDDLLCPKVYLPDIIGDILCKELGINLLIFGPVTEYNPKTGESIVKESEIDKYNPTFNCNNSNFTICISGSNTHFKSCNIMYKNNDNFILESNCKDIENSIKDINPITNKKEFQNDTCFSFQRKIYKIHTRVFDTSSDPPEIKYLFSYIPNEIITNKNILTLNNVKTYILSAKEPIIFKLNNKVFEMIYRGFKSEMASENNLYFCDGNRNIYKIYVIDYNTNKKQITETKCNINANIKELVTKYSKNPIKNKNLIINNITRIKEILPIINTKTQNYKLLNNTLKLLEKKKNKINKSFSKKKK